MQIHIKRAIERVPGGMMIVPLLIGSLVATFAPDGPKFFGSFTNALFTGALPILAVFYVCMGASINIKATPYIVKKGGVLFATKVGTAMLLGVILGHFLGESPISAGMFAGLSTLAVVAAMNDTNGGLYMALMGQYGRPEDVGAYSIMSLESGPFLTMVTLGVAGLSAFPWPTLVGSILPLMLGMLLGNLDREMRDFLSKAVPVMIPFFALALGAGLDLHKVWQAGMLGLGLVELGDERGEDSLGAPRQRLRVAQERRALRRVQCEHGRIGRRGRHRVVAAGAMIQSVEAGNVMREHFACTKVVQ